MSDLEGSSAKTSAVSSSGSVDPDALLADLQTEPYAPETWEKLERALVDEGVTETSYAAVPRLVEIGLVTGSPTWELMALVAGVELARLTGLGSPLPKQLASNYTEAVTSLMLSPLELAGEEEDPLRIRGMLCLVALCKGCSTYATAILEYSEEELGAFFLP